MPQANEAVKVDDTVKNEEIFKSFPTYKAWKRVGIDRRFGTLIPLAQIKSNRNDGVGDFADLEAFSEFCESIGCSIIQILPINDMGKGKTPYCSLSAFALDPVYIALDRVPGIRKEDRIPEMEKFLENNRKRAQKFRARKRIDFDEIRTYKIEALRIAYKNFAMNNNKDDGVLKEFKSFSAENEYWLPDYVLFRALKEKYMWDSWEKWPKGTRNRSKKALNIQRKDLKDEMDFYSYIQWIAFCQMTAVRKKLLEKGIFIKGDLPLLLDYESADVWAHQEFFNLEVCAGAPPDQYGLLGQNWGTPTYKWEKIAEDDYKWWHERLKFAENFYDIFRIDHVVGLFRIWTIPITEEYPRGKKAGPFGYFDPEDKGKGIDKKIWLKHGKTLLNMIINSTNMLPIGEDLGTIPDVCRNTLKELGIPGYKVILWERNWKKKEENYPYLPVDTYPYLSMSTTTTHDFWTFPGWWVWKEKDEEMEEEAEIAKTALWEFIGGDGERPKRYTDKLHRAIIEKMFYSSSIFLIMPFHDLWGVAFGLFNEDPVEDRINDPDKPDKPQNWNGRMPIELEMFPKHPVMGCRVGFIREMAEKSGRINFK